VVKGRLGKETLTQFLLGGSQQRDSRLASQETKVRVTLLPIERKRPGRNI